MPKARPEVRARLRYGLLRRDDRHVELRGDIRVQFELRLVGADRLDVTRQLDAATVHLGTAGRPDRRRDLGRGDRAEEASAVAGARLQLDLQVLELGLDLVRVTEVADLTGRAGPLDDLDLLLRALGPRDRVALGEQEVATEAALDLDHVAGGAETADFLGKDDLH